MPTIEDLLHDINGNTCSKLNLKSGFHQFMLNEVSCDTSLVTYRVLTRYKRLMFDLRSAPEW